MWDGGIKGEESIVMWDKRRGNVWDGGIKKGVGVGWWIKWEEA